MEQNSHLWKILDLVIAWEGLRRPWRVLWSCTTRSLKSGMPYDFITVAPYMQARSLRAAIASVW